MLRRNVFDDLSSMRLSLVEYIMRFFVSFQKEKMHFFNSFIFLIFCVNMSTGGFLSSPSSISLGVYMLNSSEQDSICIIRSYLFQAAILKYKE